MASDFWQDAGTILTGGETSEQEEIREDIERANVAAHETAETLIGDQFYGAVNEKIERLNRLKSMLDASYLNLTASERARFQVEADRLVNEIDKATKHQVDWYTPPERTYEVPTMDVETERGSRGDLDQYRVDSQAAKASADEQGLDAQRMAIEQMQEIADQEGLTAIDKARIEAAKADALQTARAQREAGLSDLAQKGQSGAGLELLSEIKANEEAANRIWQNNLQTEALAQQRTTDAIKDASGMGRDLATDVYQREFETGAAADKQEEALKEWLRGSVERDVETTNRGKEINLTNELDKNIWSAENANEAALINKEWSNEAQRYNINNMLDQIGGINTQQAALASLGLGETANWSEIQKDRPTADYGLAVGRGIELARGGKDFIDTLGGEDEDEKKKKKDDAYQGLNLYFGGGG